MYIDDKLNDIILMMCSLEQQGKIDTNEYRELDRMKCILQEVINCR